MPRNNFKQQLQARLEAARREEEEAKAREPQTFEEKLQAAREEIKQINKSLEEARRKGSSGSRPAFLPNKRRKAPWK